MTEDDAGDHGEHDHHEAGLERVTSPMQAYSMGQVWTGVAIAAVGVAVAFLVPFALA